MKKFLATAYKITQVVFIITGFVAALSAALSAFSVEMRKHYPNPNPENNEPKSYGNDPNFST